MQFTRDLESLRRHEVPDWFQDAKLGIFIHWGLFSVPSWAPITGELAMVVEREGWEAWFANNPYAEWYANSCRIGDSPTAVFHRTTYGPDATYDDFVSHFNKAAQAWDPAEWAALFKHIGARYVIPVTKHHDGFLLWPSSLTNPSKHNYRAARDIVGELMAAVREAGLRAGLYYSGGLDWTFNDTIIRDLPSLMGGIPQTTEYVAYAQAHWRELIDRYEPSIIWNDIGYPAGADVGELFAYYYNKHPDGVINDRFRQAPPEVGADGTVSLEPPAGQHFDFRTPEYTSYNQIMPYKWESTRGLGFSFGYNRNEGAEQHLSVERLIRMFVDIVSKNGNLLLNVGPMADGTIPPLQRERLHGLGDWLAVNGEAIFDTRPWITAEGRTTSGSAIRYTCKGDTVNAMLLSSPTGNEVVIEGLRANIGTRVRLLGSPSWLSWQQQDGNLAITLPPVFNAAPVHTLVLSPAPEPAGVV